MIKIEKLFMGTANRTPQMANENFIKERREYYFGFLFDKIKVKGTNILLTNNNIN